MITMENGWFVKFRPISSPLRAAYRDDVFVYTYRGADLYFMLAEAFNQLGRRAVIDALIMLVLVGILVNSTLMKKELILVTGMGLPLIGQMLVPYTIIQMELQESLAVNMVTRGIRGTEVMIIVV